jgi:hypothetical protein
MNIEKSNDSYQGYQFKIKQNLVENKKLLRYILNFEKKIFF